jgi:hypothetical protein
MFAMPPSKPRKASEFTRARELRRDGWSFKRIARKLAVSPSSVLRTQVVQHIYGAIQEYAGFSDPAWLDG